MLWYKIIRGNDSILTTPAEDKPTSPEVYQSPPASEPIAGPEYEYDLAVQQAMLIARADIAHAQALEASKTTPAGIAEEARAAAKTSFSVLVGLTVERSFAVAISHTKPGKQSINESLERAADVVQEAYLRAYRHLPKFNGEAKFETWFYRVIRNCEHWHREREGRHDHTEIDDEVNDYTHNPWIEAALAPGTVAEQNDTKRLVWSVLGELGLKDREAVVLRYILDMSDHAIAEIVGVKEGAMRIRRMRALQRMRQLLEKRGVEDTSGWL